MSSADPIPADAIRDLYAESKNYSAVARALGVSRQAVHQRLNYRPRVHPRRRSSCRLDTARVLELFAKLGSTRAVADELGTYPQAIWYHLRKGANGHAARG